MDALEEGGEWGWGGTGRKEDGGNGSQMEACPSAWLTWLPDKWRLEELVEEAVAGGAQRRAGRFPPTPPTPHAQCYNNLCAFMSAIFPPLRPPA